MRETWHHRYSSLQSIAFRLVAMTTLWSRDREIQEIARKVPDPLSMKAGSGNETRFRKAHTL